MLQLWPEKWVQKMDASEERETDDMQQMVL